MFDLKDKVALVAGGAGYLGTPICRRLAEQGATVVVADLNGDRAKALAEEIGGRGQSLDVGSEKSIKDVVAHTAAQSGRLDILVNCTYYSVGKLVEDLTEPEFDRAMHVNLTGSFLLAREAGRVMPAGGSMIFFSSMYGQVSPDPKTYPGDMKPNPIEYGVAKAGLIQMVRYLAVHWGPRNIRVNAIGPGRPGRRDRRGGRVPGLRRGLVRDRGNPRRQRRLDGMVTHSIYVLPGKPLTSSPSPGPGRSEPRGR
jgi:NAD(P)-dependent dehydrogenase (short-subunit alcohol dehydrogenase family)